MAHPLREKAAISGVGDTAYTRGTPKSGLALQLEASLAAIADAGLDPRDIDGVVPYFPGGGIAEDFVANLGLPDLTLSAFIPMGGATCVAAMQTAVIPGLAPSKVNALFWPCSVSQSTIAIVKPPMDAQRQY